MAVPWSSPELASRFDPYVEELQDFFASYGIPYGSPGDIVAVMERLAAPGPFAEDLSTMVRAIILRQGGAMPRADLLEIVAVAIGGPHIDQAAQELQPPVHKLLGFLNGVLRKPSIQPRGEESAGHSHKPLEFHAAKVPSFIRPEAVFSRLEHVQHGLEIPTTAPDPQPSITVPDGSPPLPALMHVAEPAQEFVSASAPDVEPGPAAIRGPRSTTNSVQAARWTSSSKRTAVIAGTGAIVLGAVLGVFLHPHSAVRIVSVPKANTNHVATTVSAPAAIPTSVATTNPSVNVPVFIPAKRPVRSPHSEEIIAAPYSTPIPVEPAPRRSNAAEPSVSAPRPGSDVNSSLSSGSRPAASSKHDYLAGESSGVNQPVVAGAHPVAAANRESSRDVAGRSGGPNSSRSLAPSGRYPVVSYGVMAGHLISAPHPGYPLVARIAHVKGQVILQAVIARNGSVSDAHVLRGHRLLRGSAVDAVRRWRFRPYMMEGRPVDVSTIVTVDFDNP